MKAITTDLSYVQPNPCGCPYVYQSLWDIICNQLFTQCPPLPPFQEDDVFDEVRIWNEGKITMTVGTSPYTFTIEIETDTPPKASDIIFFDKKYYIIGAVSASGDVYTCTGCVCIDISIMGVYSALINLNGTASAAEAGRVTAESGRVSAEGGRVDAEQGRVNAETQRATDFSNAQAARTVAYNAAEGTKNGSVAGDGSRWGEFKSAEAQRDATLSDYVALLMAPWVVPGGLQEGSIFVSTNEEDTPQDAKERWDDGFRTYLSVASGRQEEIVAIDDDYLYTVSGWKWRYSEED